ncbi:response regulator transcription factor [Miniphocaeibacter halophilus]|uniref:Response regulator transcription factor n=1 Tax=Miniphocaeibacter halophilus TaxID=2931922 RepID=A0AC61MTL7_9FIRM|nr:response regulator transcription factor [Miniphocaeibacter halophilus]QQK08713.1 response regulator transcription factor [Miniphocaeibacter halophilus]
MNKKILIIDDEIEMVEMLDRFFTLKNFDTITSTSGENILDLISKEPDIILLDINMPEIDGFEVCKSIRNKTNAPILFLTARNSESDKVKGLMLGAEDYIVKPFSLNELYARVYTNLQREERKLEGSDSLEIDYGARTVKYNGEEIVMTKTEFDILELLSLNPNMVFDKDRIYDSLWSYDSFGDSAVIAEHIRKIRMKIKKFTEEEYISTVWGIGYKWIG